MCELAQNSQSQVYNRVLQFKDLINGVLNGTFHMTLPKRFKKIQGTSTLPMDNKHPTGNKKKGEGKDDEGRKKQKA
jgi:hypothetical protein